jgi:hypothetical protein
MRCRIRVSLYGRIHVKINCECENKQWVALVVHFGIVVLQGGVANKHMTVRDRLAI